MAMGKGWGHTRWSRPDRRRVPRRWPDGNTMRCEPRSHALVARRERTSLVWQWSHLPASQGFVRLKSWREKNPSPALERVGVWDDTPGKNRGAAGGDQDPPRPHRPQRKMLPGRPTAASVAGVTEGRKTSNSAVVVPRVLPCRRMPVPKTWYRSCPSRENPAGPIQMKA